QAPTLIGCKFLKIDRESAVKTAQLPASFCVAASAAEKRDYEESFPLRQPLFFAHRLKKLADSCVRRFPRRPSLP
ncbi:hypothetical protein, partial [Paraburkholderia sp. BR14312]|uniref:hypothetical protein n=4 Tax=Paraburkholderia TaxID=1822464 RepID=UPI0034CFBC20